MAHQDQSRVIEILLVEDNSGDVRLTREALRESTLENHVHVLGNGLDAMEFLHRQDSFLWRGPSTRPHPSGPEPAKEIRTRNSRRDQEPCAAQADSRPYAESG